MNEADTCRKFIVPRLQHHDLEEVRARALLGHQAHRHDPGVREYPPTPAETSCRVLRGERGEVVDDLNVTNRGEVVFPGLRNFPRFLKHGATKANEIELVAPTGPDRTCRIQVCGFIAR